MPTADRSRKSRHALSFFICLLLSLFLGSTLGCSDDAGENDRPDELQPDAHDSDASNDLDDLGGADTTEEADTPGGDAQDEDIGAADAADPDAVDPDSHDPREDFPSEPWAVDQPGPYHIGYTTRKITYDARGVDEPRTLRLAIWYPTLDLEGWKGTYYQILDRPQVFKNASMGLDAPAPLLLFSHGNAAMAEQSYFMEEFFATHGWIVVAPDHTGNTLGDTMGAIDLTMAVFRPQDISAVIDHLFDLDEDDLLAGLIDEDKVALSGHSFGGFTTLAVAGASIAVDELTIYCETEHDDMCEILAPEHGWNDILRDGYFDPRVKLSIPQAPGGYQAFLDGLAEIETPTMLFTGGMDHTLKPHEEGDPIWETMQGSQHIRVNLPTAGHFSFSNLCDIFGTGVPDVAEDGCNDDFIPPPQAYDIINAYSLAFARQTLFDDHTNDDLLSGTATPYGDLVEVFHKSDTP